MQPDYSFVILTFNETLHLPRLLGSIQGLNAKIYVLDSGSTDDTLEICKRYGSETAVHPFENHPKQWHKALTVFPITTPWIIGLDADQLASPELYEQLKNFKDQDYAGIDGIYFNRKHIFRGRWIKNGGYYPKYLLKMFRYNVGYSDLTEYMDHRFIVTGKTVLWKKAHLLEENLKENEISFWISKHNRYSDLLAEEGIQKILDCPEKRFKPNFWGPPNEHNAWLKQFWWRLPRYLRPFLYFGYRLIIQKGIMDGKTGIIYHFLQGFWFRLIVDIKIEEKLKTLKITEKKPKNCQWATFIFVFPVIFLLLYGINLATIAFTSPGGFYNKTIDQHFNYIRLWRDFNLSITAAILKLFGYEVTTTIYSLHVQGRAGFKIVYSCLGYGVLSLFSAFILCCPQQTFKNKCLAILYGAVTFQILNFMRFMLLALFWTPQTPVDLHLLFNTIVYLHMTCLAYLWIKKNT